MVELMKVAIIEPVGGHGGMNYYDFGLANGLSASYCNVLVYTSEETIVAQGLPFEVKKTFRGIWGKAPKILRAARFVYCLFSSLKDAKVNDVKIVHYHFFHYTVLEHLCMTLASAFSFRIVVTAHDVESFSGKRDSGKARKILTLADRVIAHNKVSKQELISKALVLESIVRVVPHGNYLESIGDFPNKDVARKAIGLSPDDKVILFFGQIKKVKGLDILLRSLPGAIKHHPDIKLVIAGKVWKDDFSNYQKIIREHGIENNVVTYIQYIPDDDVANFYKAADLVVLPYKKIYQSGVLLMAMSFMVPVLASDLPGIIEIIKDGENGYVFESENVTSLTVELIKLFLDKSSLERIGKEGLKTVDKEYNWDRIGQMTSEIYKTIEQ